MLETGHWDPVAAPIFKAAEAQAVSRVGVVDIGSNSVRLVVFDGAARSPAYFYNEKVMCGLGQGMSETGHLHETGKIRAMAALKRFGLLARRMGLSDVTVVATAAMRDAKDGPAFRQEIEGATGLTVQVIDGSEEARLSAQGVLLGWPGSHGLVCDIGGSSMELAEIQGGQVGRRCTSALGPLKFKDLDGGRKAREKYISREMATLQETMGTQRERLFLVGGSWRAIARIDMHRAAYPLHVLHEYRMDAQSVADTVDYIRKADLDALRGACGISGSRMALVPYACEVLEQVLATFDPRDITISSYGIREGLLYEKMPDTLRAADPLIEACQFAEEKDARMPGFGARLYQFVLPLFPDAVPARLRLIKAACHLHDVSWRAHPDFRADVCFDNATRANLGGLKHADRVFLGLALLHRYRNKREGTRFEDLFALLDAPSQTEAEVLGKAMRFGAMLWSSDAKATPPTLDWSPESGKLTLHLGDEAALFGEVAEARFKSLCTALRAEDTEVVAA